MQKGITPPGRQPGRAGKDASVWRPPLHSRSLSATFSSPNLPTALLVYREKCTPRLRPGSGGEGQLACKALLHLRHQQKAQLRALSNSRRISGACPPARRRASEADPACWAGVCVLKLLWTLG